MKRNRNLLVLIVTVSIGFLIFVGFNFYQEQNVKGYPKINSTKRDTVYNSNRGNMMGRGMMSGGMMGRGMMSGNMMGQNQRQNTTNANVNWVAPSSSDNLKNPIKDIVKASREGKNIFDTQCFTCHGTTGEGNGPASASLYPKPADLISSRVQNQSDGAIFWKITNGNSPMPSFRYALSKEQRWAMVDYIRTLKK